MDKHTSKSAISIAACAAIFLTVASSSAFAGPGAKGPKASIKVQAVCSVDSADPANAILNVRTLITDKSSDSSINAIVTRNETQAIQGVGNNRKRMKFSPIGDPVLGPLGTDGVGTEYTTQINLCDAGLSSAANAANVVVTVEILDGHKIFGSKCSDDPLTEEVEGGVKIGHLALCPQNPR